MLPNIAPVCFFIFQIATNLHFNLMVMSRANASKDFLQIMVDSQYGGYGHNSFVFGLRGQVMVLVVFFGKKIMSPLGESHLSQPQKQQEEDSMMVRNKCPGRWGRFLVKRREGHHRIDVRSGSFSDEKIPSFKTSINLIYSVLKVKAIPRCPIMPA